MREAKEWEMTIVGEQVKAPRNLLARAWAGILSLGAPTG